MMNADIRPFRLAVDESALADLKRRLAHVRWPDEAPEAPWAYGTSVAFMREFVDHWAHRYDWRRTEARSTRCRSTRPRSTASTCTSSTRRGAGRTRVRCCYRTAGPARCFEFMELIPRLTDPARFGGDPADAFTVVAPSLPGYGLSFRPASSASLRRSARLPPDADDRGSATRASPRRAATGAPSSPAWLAANRADALIGIHLNLLPLRRDRVDVRESDRARSARTSTNSNTSSRRRPATSGSRARGRRRWPSG